LTRINKRPRPKTTHGERRERGSKVDLWNSKKGKGKGEGRGLRENNDQRLGCGGRHLFCSRGLFPPPPPHPTTKMIHKMTGKEKG